jgi:hypothetical protein
MKEHPKSGESSTTKKPRMHALKFSGKKGSGLSKASETEQQAGYIPVFITKSSVLTIPKLITIIRDNKYFFTGKEKFHV